MIYVKIQRRNDSELVGVCDEELLGKRFEEGNAVLDVNKNFFGGKKTDLDSLKNILDTFDNITLVGNTVVDKAIELGVVQKDSVKVIQGVKWIICLSV